jgi:23S rRNA G2445 N2-methylase RlmL
MSSSFVVFCGCVPGLEQPLVSELELILGSLSNARSRPGGVELRLTSTQIRRAHELSHLAEFVRVTIGRRKDITSFPLLEEAFARLPWHAWLGTKARFTLKATAEKSRLIHTGAIEERFVRWLTALGHTPDSESPEHYLHIRMFRDTLAVSIDSRTQPLHQRGYRAQFVNGSLRETLAAACVSATMPADVKTVCDGFAGAGTMLLESHFWPFHETTVAVDPTSRASESIDHWPAMQSDTTRARREVTKRRVIAVDVEPKALEACAHNSASLGVSWTIEQGDFSRLSSLIQAEDGPAWMLSNLPYGKLVRPPELRKTIARLVEWLPKSGLAGASILASPETMSMPRSPGWDAPLQFSNRGLGVRLYRWRA